MVRLSGGMGNQMFQYAAGRALAIRNKTSLGLDVTFLLDRTPRKNFTFREYDLDVFNIQAEIVPRSKVPFLYQSHFSGKLTIYIDKLRQRLIKTKGREKYFQFDPEALTWGPNVYLEGYWQSPKYFEGYEDIIRHDFTLKEPLSEQSMKLIEEIKNASSIGMHVRKGDYVNNTYHDVGLGKDYYTNALEYLSNKDKLGKIYVFSDDIEWCRDNLQFDVPVMYVGNEYAGKKGEEHLFLMSCCKHFIIANSSFSWWGAWLGSNSDKIVVAPKKWFADGSINTVTITPLEWIRI